jgi:hypothetical protein
MSQVPLLIHLHITILNMQNIILNRNKWNFFAVLFIILINDGCQVTIHQNGGSSLQKNVNDDQHPKQKNNTGGLPTYSSFQHAALL